MPPRSTLAALAEELTNALDPLVLAIESADAFEGFMRFLGWTTTGVIQPVQDLAGLAAGAKELVADGASTCRRSPSWWGGSARHIRRFASFVDQRRSGRPID